VQEDAALTEAICAIHRTRRGPDGVPRRHARRQDQGRRVSRTRVARLMRAAGRPGGGRRRWVHTTVSDRRAPPAPKLVARQVSVSAVTQRWVTALTSLWTAAGWLDLAARLGAHARRVSGWAMAAHPRVELPVAARGLALHARQPRSGQLVHHSDRGSQSTAGASPAVLAAPGLRCAMSRTGDCLDQALAESVFATWHRQLLPEAGGPPTAAARAAVFEWIAVYDNRQRHHSSLGYRTPLAFATAKEHAHAASPFLVCETGAGPPLRRTAYGGGVW
jgi:transposase InsO family protein